MAGDAGVGKSSMIRSIASGGTAVSPEAIQNTVGIAFCTCHVLLPKQDNRVVTLEVKEASFLYFTNVHIRCGILLGKNVM